MIDFIDYFLEKIMEENIQVYSAPKSNSNWTLPVNCLRVLEIALCNRWIIFGANLVWQQSQPFLYQMVVFGYLLLCVETLKSVYTQEYTVVFFLIASKVWFTIRLSLRKLTTPHARHSVTWPAGQEFTSQLEKLWPLDDKMSSIPTLCCCLPALHFSGLFTFSCQCFSL